MVMLRPSQPAAKEEDHKPKGFRSWPGNEIMATMFAQNNAILGVAARSDETLKSTPAARTAHA